MKNKSLKSSSWLIQFYGCIHLIIAYLNISKTSEKSKLKGHRHDKKIEKW